jgi:hypothetical protein
MGTVTSFNKRRGKVIDETLTAITACERIMTVTGWLNDYLQSPHKQHDITAQQLSEMTDAEFLAWCRGHRLV